MLCNIIVVGELLGLTGTVGNFYFGYVLSLIFSREAENKHTIGIQGFLLFQNQLAITLYSNGHPGSGQAVAGITPDCSHHRDLTTREIMICNGVKSQIKGGQHKLIYAKNCGKIIRGQRKPSSPEAGWNHKLAGDGAPVIGG